MSEKELDIDEKEVVNHVRKRAKRTRNFGKLSIIGISVIVASMILFFSVSPFQFSYKIDTSGIWGASSPKKVSERLVSGDLQILEAVKNLENQIDNLENRLSRQSDLQDSILLNISFSILRISSVFLAIYLIQILVSFTRYQFRIADHLDATADAFILSKGDPAKLTKIISSIDPQHIEFGKMPSTPTQDGIDFLKEVLSKVPTR